MALSIKSLEADHLARQIAALTGESLTDVVTVALQERLAREQRRRGRSLAAAIAEIQDEVAALPVLDDRSPDEILGYDEQGLPT
jgi:antitoxin VapB